MKLLSWTGELSETGWSLTIKPVSTGMSKDCVKYLCFCSIQLFVDFFVDFSKQLQSAHPLLYSWSGILWRRRHIYSYANLWTSFLKLSRFFRGFGTIKFLHFNITTFSFITLSVSWWFNVLHARTNICSLSFIVFASAPLFSAPLFGGSAAIEWITLSSSGVSVADSRAKTQRILQGNDSTIPRWVKTSVTSILW